MTGFARVVLCAVTLATATTACAQNSKQDKQAADAIAKGLGSPLAGFASQRIIVLPVQLLRGDSLSWIQPSGWTAFRTELDDSVASAISERGIGKGWAYPADVVRQAKRNAGYVGDPYSIGAQPLRGQNYRPADHIPPLRASFSATPRANGPCFASRSSTGAPASSLGSAKSRVIRRPPTRRRYSP
jgi:hypothetical protein